MDLSSIGIRDGHVRRGLIAFPITAHQGIKVLKGAVVDVGNFEGCPGDDHVNSADIGGARNGEGFSPGTVANILKFAPAKLTFDIALKQGNARRTDDHAGIF